MRTSTTLCDRCGQVILEGGSVVDVTAGELRKAAPSRIDLCLDCAGGFVDWLWQGHSGGRGATIKRSVDSQAGSVPASV